MNLPELNNLLKATGYPVAYSHFANTPTIPFITYLEAYSSNSFADNKTFHKVKNVQIELYTNKKDLAVESKLESILDSNSVPYDSTETFIESENLFQKIYEVRMI
ncbi:MAG: hypothetical protein ACQET8_22755 [Bacillota bacterium]